jgi:hypothetical protein
VDARRAGVVDPDMITPVVGSRAAPGRTARGAGPGRWSEGAVRQQMQGTTSSGGQR